MRLFIFFLALFGSLLGETLAQQEVIFDCSQMPSVCTNMCWGIYCAFGDHNSEALLTYDAPDDETARQRRISAGCNPSGNRCAGGPHDANSCDEYPFSKTREADQVAQVNRCVPQTESSRQRQRLQELYNRLNAPEKFMIGFTHTDVAGVQFCNYDDACKNDGTIYQEDDVAPNPPNNAAVRLKYRYLLESGVEYISHVDSPVGKMVKRLVAVEGNETETADGEEDSEGWVWVEDYIYRRLAQDGDEEDPEWVPNYIYRRDAQDEKKTDNEKDEEDLDWVADYVYRRQDNETEVEAADVEEGRGTLDWVINYIYRREDETETDIGAVNEAKEVDPDWVVDYIYRGQENATDTGDLDGEGEEEGPNWVVDYIYRRNPQDDGTGADTGVVDGEGQGEKPDWVVDYIYRRHAQVKGGDETIHEDPNWISDYIYRRDVQDDGDETQTDGVDSEQEVTSKWQWVEKYIYRRDMPEEGDETGASDGEGKGEDPDWAVDYIYRRDAQENETGTEPEPVSGDGEESDWVVDYIYRRD